MFELKKIAPSTYILPQTGGMRVPGLIIASEEQLKNPEMEKPLEQVRNVAHLPGIVGYSIAMPDIHWGYGFPIGGVAATCAEVGVISPGGVGYDINCGVRLALVATPYRSLDAHKKDQLLQAIFDAVPSGVGHGHKGAGLSDSDYKKMLQMGAAWSIAQGFGLASDLEHMESRGCIEGSDFGAVSQEALDRGRKQLGSIGSGNHFVEIGEVQKILHPAIAKTWNVEEGNIYILIHSGSRGFGHQACQDTLDSFVRKGYAQDLPDVQLVAAPVQSADGKKYFAAMAAAANFAFNNRQQILHRVRESFSKVLHIPPQDIPLLYDVCHNIAKFETYEGRRLCVHRKGATRAFGPGAPELPPHFQTTGQPVFVPGDMGRASYILAGLGNPLTWHSACHGAGRLLSRHKSMEQWRHQDLRTHMRERGVQVLATSLRTVAEEMPSAYKNVDDVVAATVEAKLGLSVARLKPHLVIKG